LFPSGYWRSSSMVPYNPFRPTFLIINNAFFLFNIFISIERILCFSVSLTSACIFLLFRAVKFFSFRFILSWPVSLLRFFASLITSCFLVLGLRLEPRPTLPLVFSYDFLSLCLSFLFLHHYSFFLSLLHQQFLRLLLLCASCSNIWVLSL